MDGDLRGVERHVLLPQHAILADKSQIDLRTRAVDVAHVALEQVMHREAGLAQKRTMSANCGMPWRSSIIAASTISTSPVP